MNTKFVVLIIVLFSVFATAQTRFEVAKKTASEKNELIILNFSGSDWCIPCIKLHKNIIESNEFKKLTDEKVIVYLNADFPRNKKNQPSSEIKKENAALADIYNKNGLFPLTLLLNYDGKVLKTWEGLPSENAETFTQEILSFHHNK